VKKFVATSLILALATGMTFAQLRVDAGIAVPIGIGVVLDGTSLEMSSAVGDFLSSTFLPLPEAALHYQFDLGHLKLGVGVRAFTLILETMLWPNAFVEYDFGPIVAEAQVGGGAFMLLGLVSDFQTGEVFFPDLSVWAKLGVKQNVRLGGGIIGIFLPNQSSSFPVVVYLGGKIALTPNS
jgi:hypothetical protein